MTNHTTSEREPKKTKEDDDDSIWIQETEAEAKAIVSAGLPPARPGFTWAAYCKSIDGHLSVSFALNNVPSRDYDFEQIPLVVNKSRQQLRVNKQ